MSWPGLQAAAHAESTDEAFEKRSSKKIKSVVVQNAHLMYSAFFFSNLFRTHVDFPLRPRRETEGKDLCWSDC